MNHLQLQFDNQQFCNEYQLVNGVAGNHENFHVPPDVIKRHVRPGQFVEIRIDSPRFSVHAGGAQKGTCPSCRGELTKPILRHDRLLAETGIDPERTAGIGDTMGDRFIAERVSWFGCPANAEAAIRKSAAYVSPHHEVEGVLDILHRLSS